MLIVVYDHNHIASKREREHVMENSEYRKQIDMAMNNVRDTLI